MGLADVAAQIEADERRNVRDATFGHLAPKRGSRYRVRITFAVGCLGHDPLNPTILAYESRVLEMSPWLFEAALDMFRELETEEGCVYEWVGTFRDYKWNGTCRLLTNTNKSN